MIRYYTVPRLSDPCNGLRNRASVTALGISAAMRFIYLEMT